MTTATGVTVGARTGGTLAAGAYTLTLRVPVKAAAWTGETGDAPVQDPAFTSPILPHRTSYGAW